jgi:hypothetical protein
MGVMAVACENCIITSILAYGGTEVVILLFVRPFSRMGDMAVAGKNAIRPSIFPYGWHGGSDGLIGPHILAYVWHGGREKEYVIHFGVRVAWR